MLAPNTILQSRYRILRELGRGGMGAVYEAMDERLNRVVAVKETLVETEDLRRAFEREARLLANLRHAALPKVIDHFTEGAGQFLVMEYIGGDDLSALLKRRSQPFPLSDVLRWADEILAALSYIHAQQPPVIHRDIKPANLKLTAQNEITLLDFGLAKGHAGGMTLATSDKSLYGYTPQYAPLEQVNGEGTTAQSDLYALAATLNHLLTNRVPPSASQRAASIVQTGLDPLQPLDALNPEVPLTISTILMRAMSLKQRERPASASEMRASLRDGLRTIVSTAAPPSPNFSPHASYNAQLQPTMLASHTPAAPPLDSWPRPLPATPIPFFSPPAPKKNAGGRWWILASVFLGFVALTAIGFGVARFVLNQKDSPAPRPTPIPSANDAVPSPYRELLPSVVSLTLQDAEGRTLRQGSGFFVREDEIVTALSAIEGATGGRATIIDKGTSLQLVGVTAVDREANLILIKVAGGKSTPLPVKDNQRTTLNQKIALLGGAANAVATFNTGTIGGYEDDLISINAPFAQTNIGGPLLNERGEAVGLLLKPSPTNQNVGLAAPINTGAALMRRRQPLSSIALNGANNVLWDFRKTTSSTPPNLSDQAKSRILSIVFRSYLTGTDQCQSIDGDAGNDFLAEQRAAGQFVPEIVSSASGSFTAPGLQQTAYLIEVGECNASHADNYGTKRLVIFNDQNLVANVDAELNTSILKPFDINADGINELLLSGGDMHMGINPGWGTLVDFNNNRPRVIRKFERVYEDSCESERRGSSSLASVILYAPTGKGRMPEIRVDWYRAPCAQGDVDPKPEDFKYVASGKMPE
ncbi:MAG: protein kinase [Pyrinomonadaceae bacterium]|nr:protein kinase [Pyrinomonadaceae bacterium]